MDSINSTDMALLDKEISNEAESELGPLKYLAEITGQDMSVVVNWFLLLIIFVFDPLAIALVIAANFAFSQLHRTSIDKLTEEDREWLEADLTEDDDLEWEEPKSKNLDLDGDGVVEEEELQQVFNEADTNDDGYIDEEEAKAANLDLENTLKLNQFNESLERLENVTNSFTGAEYGKKREALEEVNKLKELLVKQFQSKQDDTITIF